jgi:ATP-binding cassette, subfamily C, type I secretion system permease/ATPase
MFRNVIKGAVLRGVFVVSVLTFVLNTLALVLPIYMLQIYDRVLPSSSFATLAYLTLIAIAMLTVLGAIEGVRHVLVQRVGTRLEVDAGERLLANCLRRSGSQDTPGLLRELAQARAFLSGTVFSALLDAPFAPLFTALVFLIHPMLGSLVVAAAAILFVLTLLNQGLLHAPQSRATEAAATASTLVGAFTRSSEIIRAMGMSRDAVSTWGEAMARALNAQDRATRANATFAGFSRFIRLGTQVGILGLGAYLTLQQEITAGMIFAVSLVAARALAPVDNLIAGWKGLLQAVIGLRRIDRSLADAKVDRPQTALPRPTGLLVFDKVLFLPPGAAEATIRAISLKVSAGEAVCLVGPSGAGKSTFAKLAAGAMAPSRGIVRLDGSDLQNWDPDQRGKFIGYLPQDVELLPATVAENIARLDATATSEEIIAAADLAGVSELVKGLPNGYDTRVGPGGLPLSGGQRQRIALARAVFRSPSLVVLDEPNAHLDSDGEAALNKAIATLKQAGTTVIVVSQRSGVLRSVDRILFMRDGQVVASQGRDEALAKVLPAQREPESPRIVAIAA